MTASLLPPPPDPKCSFCKGRGVLNARAWTTPGESLYAACPRCGGVPDKHAPSPFEHELRVAWLARRRIRVVLSDRCAVPVIVGRVANVSVTGSLAIIDGWTIPVAEVSEITVPTPDDLDAYALMMHDLREAARS